MYTCPVCYFAGMQDPPMDYNICECCGTEFGNDDEERSHDELRAVWISAGAKWFFRTPPVGWNPWTQLFNANVRSQQLDNTSTIYGGPAAESMQMVYTPNLAGLHYYGAVTLYGGNALEAETAISARSGQEPFYHLTSPIYFGTTFDTATTTYAAQDVLASAA